MPQTTASNPCSTLPSRPGVGGCDGSDAVLAPPAPPWLGCDHYRRLPVCRQELPLLVRPDKGTEGSGGRLAVRLFHALLLPKPKSVVTRGGKMVVYTHRLG